MANSGIERDGKFSTSSSSNFLKTPIIDITSTNPAEKGKIGYDRNNDAMFYSNGVVWLPIDDALFEVHSRVFLNTTIITAPSSSNIIFDTIESESSNIYNTSTGVFTIPVSKVYAISANVLFVGFSSPGPSRILVNFNMIINGGSPPESSISLVTTTAVFIPPIQTHFPFYREISLTAGDTVNFNFVISGGGSANIVGAIAGKFTWASVRSI